MMSNAEKRRVLSQACPLWGILSADVQSDLVSGKAIYRQHECVPIIDYTEPHPFFSEPEAA